ncbi:hypothetical protein [Streptomyces sp. NPDC018036]|uniref:zinc finger domain-containing protein n=1 Tax=Streptomyces sp. NPDC018036 TaxID=3365035 RepID=UPI0037923214
MSRRARRHGSGGRTGQHYNATPDLRSYSTPPAGPVTVTRADGTVETETPKKAVRSVPQPRRKNKRTVGSKPSPPPMPTMRQLLTVDCPACGRKVAEPCTMRQGHRARVEMYLAVMGTRGTPEKVVAAVQKGAEVREEKAAARRRPVPPEEQARRAEQRAAAEETRRQKAARGYPGSPTQSVNTRAVSPDLVRARRCPRCGAPEGEPCSTTMRNGSPALHLERVQDARRELAKRR